MKHLITLIAVMILGFGSAAQAAPVKSSMNSKISQSGERAIAREALLSIGSAMNYQLAPNGRDYEAKTPFTLRAGLRFAQLDVYSEYSYLSNPTTGAEMVQIGSKTHELLLWARKGFSIGLPFKPFAALGAGANITTVTTKFDGETRKDAGQLEGLVSVAGGVLVRLHRNIELTAEGRVTSAASMTPNPLFGLGCFLGVVF